MGWDHRQGLRADENMGFIEPIEGQRRMGLGATWGEIELETNKYPFQ